MDPNATPIDITPFVGALGSSLLGVVLLALLVILNPLLVLHDLMLANFGFGQHVWYPDRSSCAVLQEIR